MRKAGVRRMLSGQHGRETTFRFLGDFGGLRRRGVSVCWFFWRIEERKFVFVTV